MSLKLMRPWSFSVVAVLLAGCTSTELSVPRAHPGSPLAPTARVPFAAPLADTMVRDTAQPTEGDAAAPGHHHHQAEAASPADSAAPAVTYTCVMHPQIVRDKPGNCPICGMKLVPKKDGK